MLKYILVRVLWMFVMLTIIVCLVNILAHIANWKVWQAHSLPFSDFAHILFQRFWRFVRGVVTEWNWGDMPSNETVWSHVIKQAPKTLRVVFLAMVFSLIVGIFLGIVSALNKGNIIDHVIGAVTHIMGSIPNFIWVFIFIMVFAYQLRVLPPSPPPTDLGWWPYAQSYIIPVVGLSLAPIAQFTMLIRGELSEAFHSEYIFLLRAKGLNTRQIIQRHLFRDSVVAIIPQIGPNFLFIIAGSFLVERIANINGISLLMYHGLFGVMGGQHFIRISVPIITMACAFYVTLGMVASLIADILGVLVDPRLRAGEKKDTSFST